MRLLRWAGGKGRLLPAIRARLPDEFRLYHEPFLGSGTLFETLGPVGAFVADANPELVNLYNVIKHRPAALLQVYHGFAPDKAAFYRLRNVDRSPAFRDWSPPARAARFLFLNRAGFNGSMRVNGRGKLTVTYGAPTARRLAVDEAVWAWHARLRQTRLWCASFDRAEAAVGPGDFVYFDPPYLPIAGRRIMPYTSNTFGPEMHARLAQICGRLHKRGAMFMLSNADAPWIDRLFNGFRIERLNVYRSLAGSASGREAVSEVLITNYT
jgi:DNA adenine methylase